MLRTMKQPVIPEIKPRKKYDRNFKQQAVTLWLSSGKSAPTVAAELGLRDKQLYEWKKTFVPAPGSSAKHNPAPGPRRMSSLRRRFSRSTGPAGRRTAAPVSNSS